MKQKLILFLFAFLFVQPRSVSAQAANKNVQFLIDTCITIMKNNAVNAGKVNWAVLRENALHQAAHINSPYELGPVMRFLYGAINDFHGAFFYRDSTFQWQRNASPIPDSIMNEWKKGVTNKTLLLANNIGYLRVPSMPGGSKEDFDKKAQGLNDSLCLLLTQGIKGIVLDLRLNGGGAMFPMILGVKQLLNQGLVGHFETKKREDWFIKQNDFFIDTNMLASITPKCNVNAQSIPVVILTGRATGSSGEFMAMAFIGREKTVLLGSKTAGYVTVNSGFPINDTAFMNLSIGYGADRKGKVYKDAIVPDITFQGIDKFNDIKSDVKVNAAIRWLQNSIK